MFIFFCYIQSFDAFDCKFVYIWSVDEHNMLMLSLTATILSYLWGH